MTWHNYHWLTDVLAAWLLGTLLLAVLSRRPFRSRSGVVSRRHAALVKQANPASSTTDKSSKMTYMM